jgi:transcriptional antiterminator RfaH
MQYWYVLHTKPHKERQVLYYFRQRNIETYLPLLHVHPVNPRAARERAFFPCYIFAHLDIQSQGIASVQWTPGLRRVLEFGGQPATVPDRYVAELKQRVAAISAAGGLLFDGLKQGDTVRITNGPFAGYEAIFDARLAGTERVRVLLEWLQQHQHHRFATPVVPVELNASSIEKVKLRR